MTAKLKPKKCRQCKAEFYPGSSMQIVCSPICAHEYARNKRQQRESKEQRARDRVKRESLKSASEWAKEAQTAFNAFIRARDWGKPCISCDRMHGRDHQRHASHYRSVKAAKQLRFNTWNVHTSCAQCNTHDSGNILEYRIRLALKIGEERLQALECNNDLANHDIEYYKRVKRIFNRRTKLYKKIRGIA